MLANLEINFLTHCTDKSKSLKCSLKVNKQIVYTCIVVVDWLLNSLEATFSLIKMVDKDKTYSRR